MTTFDFYVRQFAHLPRRAAGSFEAKMVPPKPGEKCALCGQVKRGPGDEVAAQALRALSLCKKAGLTTRHAAELLRLKLLKSELQALAKLAAPDLKNAILLRTTADVWDGVIAELGLGKSRDQVAR